MATSLELARAHHPLPISAVAAGAGLDPDETEPYGRDKAKISLSVLERLCDTPDAKLVCVTAITPTPAGEDNITTAIGLTDGLATIGQRAVACLREPSLADAVAGARFPVGGGRAQLVPTDDLNLHFTGDIHAAGAANNLLAAMVDASILHGNPLAIDMLQIPWQRAVSLSDTALRKVIIGRGGRANGYPRQTGFAATTASEVMGILAVSRSLEDLRQRLGQMTAAYSDEGRPITADALGAGGAMTVLLKDALKPNLVQTLQGQPAIVHCGSRADSGLGNNSLIADLIALKLSDYVVTECGSAKTGLEKFLSVVCRIGGLTPSAIVLAVTTRVLTHPGRGASDGDHAGSAAGDAVPSATANIHRHLAIAAQFGVPTVVAINRLPRDQDREIKRLSQMCVDAGAVASEVSDAFSQGGTGAAALADTVMQACRQPSAVHQLYRDDASIQDKLQLLATHVYGAAGAKLSPQARQKTAQFTREGLDRLPVCAALCPGATRSTQHEPLPVSDICAFTGAGWLVPSCGEPDQTPTHSSADPRAGLDITAAGQIVGLR